VNPFFAPERPFSNWAIQGLDEAPAILLEHCGSTHRFVHDHFRELKAGTIVVANDQAQGRGRHDRVWRAPAGKNLSFNILIPLFGLSPEQWAQTTQIAAIVLARLIRDLSIPVSVKWPNDLLWDKHKICGILSELLSKGEERFLSLGIGLNVNTDIQDFVGLDRLAASLKTILGIKLDRESLLNAFVTRMSAALDLFRREGSAPWIAEWKKMDQFLGTVGRVVLADSALEGVIQDIQEDGSLLFKTQQGDVLSIWSGDLEV